MHERMNEGMNEWMNEYGNLYGSADFQTMLYNLNVIVVIVVVFSYLHAGAPEPHEISTSNYAAPSPWISSAAVYANQRSEIVSVYIRQL